MRSMTKSPIALAREALKAAQSALPKYSSRCSRKDFTQHQLFALPVLHHLFKTDYRGLVQLVDELSDLREALAIVPRISPTGEQVVVCLEQVRRMRGAPKRI